MTDKNKPFRFEPVNEGGALLKRVDDQGRTIAALQRENNDLQSQLAAAQHRATELELMLAIADNILETVALPSSNKGVGDFYERFYDWLDKARSVQKRIAALHAPTIPAEGKT